MSDVHEALDRAIRAVIDHHDEVDEGGHKQLLTHWIVLARTECMTDDGEHLHHLHPNGMSMSVAMDIGLLRVCEQLMLQEWIGPGEEEDS